VTSVHAHTHKSRNKHIGYWLLSKERNAVGAYLDPLSMLLAAHVIDTCIL